ncbi:DUF6503 family protein [Maribacter halichondriae]|uniref:DUF6503 family protein n=1 Tax=Maribacter halichondriae TaxID=2980554 RepID=UPI00235A4101|nr:DUF6503 family protein [Maribacter sp. Hal144]
MTRYILFSYLLLTFTKGIAQQITGEQLLENAIQYHDPDGNWQSFKGILEVTMTTPDEKRRISTIKIDFPQRFFELSYSQDGNDILQRIHKNDCTLSLNGSNSISNEAKEEYRLTCDRAKLMKDYYTYLYGLPMKLKNPGTVISSKVESKKFKGKEYLVLKTSYEEAVGKDVWYFYFDPKTYAMEVYQFFHDEAKNDGEYILLSGEETVSGIKMPKTRAWYYNKDENYLGTDVLTKTSSL